MLIYFLIIYNLYKTIVANERIKSGFLWLWRNHSWSKKHRDIKIENNVSNRKISEQCTIIQRQLVERDSVCAYYLSHLIYNITRDKIENRNKNSMKKIAEADVNEHIGWLTYRIFGNRITISRMYTYNLKYAEILCWSQSKNLFAFRFSPILKILKQNISQKIKIYKKDKRIYPKANYKNYN